jgi:hypothetical protein
MAPTNRLAPAVVSPLSILRALPWPKRGLCAETRRIIEPIDVLRQRLPRPYTYGFPDLGGKAAGNALLVGAYGCHVEQWRGVQFV